MALRNDWICSRNAKNKREKKFRRQIVLLCVCADLPIGEFIFVTNEQKKKKEHSFYSCFFFAFWQVGCQKNATFFFLRHFSEADLSPEAVNRKRGPSQKKKRKKQKLKKKLGKSKPRLWNISIFFSHRLWHPENSVQQKNIQFFIFDQVQRNLRENVLQNGDTELILSNISGKNSI